VSANWRIVVGGLLMGLILAAYILAMVRSAQQDCTMSGGFVPTPPYIIVFIGSYEA
jgi:uncharacterized integral membrane protein